LWESVTPFENDEVKFDWWNFHLGRGKMSSPKVSVIIPTYNHANYIAAAIQSVLDQTCQDFEIIIVNDASTDQTDEVIRQFDDPRIKYLVNENNRYAAATRNTGIRASCGELIAFLDADDLIHPAKLQTQIAFLEENPSIGLTYNSRFEIDQSGNLLSIAPAQPVVTLSDLVMGYPYSPSEVVMRKDWVVRVGLFDESFVFHGEDPDFFMRLALHGCQMAGVNQFLNYRRLHVGRVFRNLANIVEGEIRAFENTFANPLCPPEVLKLREKSLGQLYLIYTYHAFVQNETSLGREYFNHATHFKPDILEFKGEEFLRFMIASSTRDGGDHEARLRSIFAQLSPEYRWLATYAESAIAYGYLIKGARDILWNRLEQGEANLRSAGNLGARINNQFIQEQTKRILDFEAAFDPEDAKVGLENISKRLSLAGTFLDAQRLKGCFYVNRAFSLYRQRDFAKVLPNVLKAIAYNPIYTINRGVIAMLIRSILPYDWPFGKIFGGIWNAPNSTR
jgi:glycosyltransferase involved in cell wall biosynthesis